MIQEGKRELSGVLWRLFLTLESEVAAAQVPSANVEETKLSKRAKYDK